MRIRDAAQHLGVTEMELLTVSPDMEKVTYLGSDYEAILGKIEGLGKVMGLTRNESVVHERKGVYSNYEQMNQFVGLFVNPDIDLRMFTSNWKYIFAVEFLSRGKLRRSIQFFDNRGEAIHKIYLTPKSNEAAFDTLVQKHQVPKPSEWQFDNTPPELTQRAILTENQKEEFQNAWVNLKDTHHFFPLMKKYGLTRLQALEFAPENDLSESWFPKFAFQVPNSTMVTMMEAARDRNTEIMVFVGNLNMIQIHTGPVKKLMEYGAWYNVMDPDFNLHVNTADISSSWLVFKPTEDGLVSSLEVFDQREEMIVQFFGKRKPGIPESKPWRDIIKSLIPND